MTKFIVVTGASKGIGRAAVDAQVDDGWSVIGVARTSPRHFLGSLHRNDLANRGQTQALADHLGGTSDRSVRKRGFGAAVRLGVKTLTGCGDVGARLEWPGPLSFRR